MNKTAFSVNTYDRDGDLITEGIFLHFGDTAIKVADNLAEFDVFVNSLKCMRKEIVENL